MAQGVAARVSQKHVHPHVIMCPIVRCLFTHLPFVRSFHLLYPGHHPPCGRNRRELNPCAHEE